MPAGAGRIGVARGEAVGDPISDEASGPRQDTENTGSEKVLTIAYFDHLGVPRLS